MREFYKILCPVPGKYLRNRNLISQAEKHCDWCSHSSGIFWGKTDLTRKEKSWYAAVAMQHTVSFTFRIWKLKLLLLCCRSQNGLLHLRDPASFSTRFHNLPQCFGVPHHSKIFTAFPYQPSTCGPKLFSPLLSRSYFYCRSVKRSPECEIQAPPAAGRAPVSSPQTMWSVSRRERCREGLSCLLVTGFGFPSWHEHHRWKKMAQGGIILCRNTSAEHSLFKGDIWESQLLALVCYASEATGCCCQVCPEPDILSEPLGMVQQLRRVLRLHKGQKPD